MSIVLIEAMYPCFAARSTATEAGTGEGKGGLGPEDLGARVDSTLGLDGSDLDCWDGSASLCKKACNSAIGTF